MSAPGKLVRSSRWKSGPSKGQRPLGSECCVVTGDAAALKDWIIPLSSMTTIASGTVSRMDRR